MATFLVCAIGDISEWRLDMFSHRVSGADNAHDACTYSQCTTRSQPRGTALPYCARNDSSMTKVVFVSST